jgi:hypothetical protein
MIIRPSTANETRKTITLTAKYSKLRYDRSTNSTTQKDRLIRCLQKRFDDFLRPIYAIISTEKTNIILT